MSSREMKSQDPVVSSQVTTVVGPDGRRWTQRANGLYDIAGEGGASSGYRSINGVVALYHLTKPRLQVTALGEVTVSESPKTPPAS